MQITIQTCLGRRGQMAIQRMHVVAIALHHLNEEILSAAGQRDACRWQILAKPSLVDDTLVVLARYFIGQLRAYLKQLLIAFIGIHAQVEVTTIDDGMRRVTPRKQVYPHIVRTVYLRMLVAR